MMHITELLLSNGDFLPLFSRTRINNQFYTSETTNKYCSPENKSSIEKWLLPAIKFTNKSFKRICKEPPLYENSSKKNIKGNSEFVFLDIFSYLCKL